MSQETISKIVEGRQWQKPIALCFGFEHSPFSTDSVDRTGAPILLNLLLSEALQSSNGYMPLVISSSASCKWIRKRCDFPVCIDKRDIERKFGFDNKAFVNYEWLCSILSELEMLSLRRAYFRRMTEEDRRYHLVQKIRFWASIFEKNDIGIYINSNVPHLLDDYVAYRFAKYYNVPVVCAYRLPIVRGVMCRLMFFSDPLLQGEPFSVGNGDFSRADDLGTLYERCVRQGVDLDKIEPGTRENCDDSRLSVGDKLNSIKRKSVDGVRKISSFSYWNSQRAYVRNATPVPEGKYLYFPLHFQPEASSRPLGGLWADQELVVETISQALPRDISLVVKEHPVQHSRQPGYRSRKFYENIASQPNVHLIPAHLESAGLVREAIGIVTLTGTTALEGIMKKKRCFIFGATPLLRGPGVCSPRSFEELEDNIKTLSIAEISSVPDAAIREFFVWLEKHSIAGYLEPYTDPKMGNQLSAERNIESVSGAFQNCIGKLLNGDRTDRYEKHHMGMSI